MAERKLRIILLITLVLGFLALGYGGYLTYRDTPPWPQVGRGPQGVLFTRRDLDQGRQFYQRYDLMDQTSLYGNGSPFGVDLTADYLHREVGLLREEARRNNLASQTLEGDWVRRELRANRYRQDVLYFDGPQTRVFRTLEKFYARVWQRGDPTLGVVRGLAVSPGSVHALASFLAWSAWTTVAERPGTQASYTGNWPYDPEAGNFPTPAAFLWTWISLGIILATSGLVVYLYLDLLSGPWERARMRARCWRSPPPTPVTAGQISLWPMFTLSAALFVLQALVGTLLAHYYVEKTGFFGFDTTSLLPFQLVRSWHLELAILWILIGWMAAGIFLALSLAGREPASLRRLIKGQEVMLAVLGGGSLLSLWLDATGHLPAGALAHWLGNQGLSYLSLGVAFQWLLGFTLILWMVTIGIILWGYGGGSGERGLKQLFVYSSVAITLLFGVGAIMVMRSGIGFAVMDFWRWWIVHLWVEQAFEFFSITITAFVLVSLRLIPYRTALRAAYFELILVFLSGSLGLGHHLYWTGNPTYWLAAGAVFGFLEVLPLFVIAMEAVAQEKILLRIKGGFPQKLTFTFLAGSSFWNFFGAGVLGGLVNAPLINYYEHGTFLTLAHAHTAFFGVFGFLTIGLVYYALKGLSTAVPWDDRLGLIAYWCFNAGMAIWLITNFFPVGFSQLVNSQRYGYWYARGPLSPHLQIFHWARLPGDLAFLAGSVLFFWDLLRKVGGIRRRERVHGLLQDSLVDAARTSRIWNRLRLRAQGREP